MRDLMSEQELIEALSRLRPLSPESSAVAIAFAAGQRSMRASRRRWRAAAGVCAVALAVVAGRSAGPSSANVTVVAIAPPTHRASSGGSVDVLSALGMRSVIEEGVESLPKPRGIAQRRKWDERLERGQS
jgi:hypothetical protein